MISDLKFSYNYCTIFFSISSSNVSLLHAIISTAFVAGNGSRIWIRLALQTQHFFLSNHNALIFFIRSIVKMARASESAQNLPGRFWIRPWYNCNIKLLKLFSNNVLFFLWFTVHKLYFSDGAISGPLHCCLSSDLCTEVSDSCHSKMC